MKKIIAILLVVIMTIGVLAGCAKNIDNGGTTNLIMYLIGEKPGDYDEVLTEVNKMLLEDINAQLNVKWIAWSDVAKKYPMILSSGEEFDLILVTSSVDYYGLAKKNAYMDITELAKEYAPVTYEELDPSLIKNASVSGKLYALPANWTETNDNGLAIRGDLRKKYNIPEIKDFDGLMAYMKAVSENESDIMAFNASKTDSLTRYMAAGISGVPLMGSVEPGADPTALYAECELPGYVEYAKKAREGYENGYWSKDILMNDVPSKDSFINGVSAVCGGVNLKNFNALYNTVVASHPDWEPEFYMYESEKPTVYKQTAAVSVSRTSKNPEKALQLLELLNQDERYFNLTTYGIEGKDYVLTEDGKRTALPEGVTAATVQFTADNAGNWGWRNKEMFKFSVDSPEGFEEKLDAVYSNGVWSPYTGFIPDVTSIKTEIAMVTEVNNRYGNVVKWGTSADVEGTIAEWKAELQRAGIEKIRAEIKEQLNEFLANQ